MWNAIKRRIGDIADTVSPEIVEGQIRHALTGAGGAAIVGSFSANSFWLFLVGAVAYAIGASWSWAGAWTKRWRL